MIVLKIMCVINKLVVSWMLRKWGSWFGNSTVHKLEKSSRILHIFTGYLLSCSLNSSTLLVVSIHLRGGESLLVFCFRGLSRLVYHLYVVWLFASSLMNFWFTYKKKKLFNPRWYKLGSLPYTISLVGSSNSGNLIHC